MSPIICQSTDTIILGDKHHTNVWTSELSHSLLSTHTHWPQPLHALHTAHGRSACCYGHTAALCSCAPPCAFVFSPPLTSSLLILSLRAPQCPIYCTSGALRLCNMYYRLFAQWAGEHVHELFDETGRNPLSMAPHVSIFHKQQLDQQGPCVLLASPAMCQAGNSLEALRRWAGNSNDLVLFTSHQIKGTLGHALLNGAKQITVAAPASQQQHRQQQQQYSAGGGLPSSSMMKLDVKCEVKQISFAAHADAKGLLSLIRTVKPCSVVLVHGDRYKMRPLQKAITDLFGVECLTPQNGEGLILSAAQSLTVRVTRGAPPHVVAPAEAATEAAKAEVADDKAVEREVRGVLVVANEPQEEGEAAAVGPPLQPPRLRGVAEFERRLSGGPLKMRVLLPRVEGAERRAACRAVSISTVE